MRRNVLANLLVGALIVSAVFATWASIMYYVSIKRFQRAQAEVIRANETFNNTRSNVLQLANEALEYSKRNPAIDPILQQFAIKPNPTNVPPQPTNVPAAK